MAYTDPTRVRKHRVGLNFDDREIALIDAFIAYTGAERAAYIREMILREAQVVLTAEHNSEGFSHAMERPYQTLRSV
jgi:hypothetical protein